MKDHDEIARQMQALITAEATMICAADPNAPREIAWCSKRECRWSRAEPATSPRVVTSTGSRGVSGSIGVGERRRGTASEVTVFVQRRIVIAPGRGPMRYRVVASPRHITVSPVATR